MAAFDLSPVFQPLGMIALDITSSIVRRLLDGTNEDKKRIPISEVTVVRLIDRPCEDMVSGVKTIY